ncbi:hypothetical protein [Salarchaeum sp. JOR-1]|nr:hypothetical protein [Salarchaeum sp. JOR-1]
MWARPAPGSVHHPYLASAGTHAYGDASYWPNAEDVADQEVDAN